MQEVKDPRNLNCYEFVCSALQSEKLLFENQVSEEDNIAMPTELDISEIRTVQIPTSLVLEAVQHDSGQVRDDRPFLFANHTPMS